ncbi:MAG: hypothetical protein ABEJ42_04720 [Halobacteriaceae archaeon]
MRVIPRMLQRYKDETYTGDNRCARCTAVNAVVAVVLAGGVVVAGAVAGALVAGLAGGAVVLAVSAAAIYFRGYLVPGTPALTKRYFPDDLLAWFGKADGVGETAGDRVARPEDDAGAAATRDVETLFVEQGLLTECTDVDDLCLTESFRATWQAAVGDRATAAEQLGALFAEPPTFAPHGDGIRAETDAGPAAEWPSEAALRADAGAAHVLRGRDWFDAFPRATQLRVLESLRLFVETCPSCGGEPTLGTETVESCCTTVEVHAVACEDCDARLLEVRA